MFAGIVGIDMVVTDAEGRDDFKLGKPGERLGVAPDRIVGDRNTANFFGDRRCQPFEVSRGLEGVQDKLVRKTVTDNRLMWPT